MEKNNFFFPHH